MLSKVKQKPKSKLSLQTLNKLELESERQQRIGGTRPPAQPYCSFRLEDKLCCTSIAGELIHKYYYLFVQPLIINIVSHGWHSKFSAKF